MMPMPVTIEPTLTYPSRGDGGLGWLEAPRGLLPLTALSVEARVTGLEVATELRQTFFNTTGAPIEATYISPLPDRAAVHRFRMAVARSVVETEMVDGVHADAETFGVEPSPGEDGQDDRHLRVGRDRVGCEVNERHGAFLLVAWLRRG